MRTLKNTFVLLLVVLMMISASSIALAGTNDKKSSTLSIEDGKEIALFYTIDLSNTISELADWNGASVEHEITYYDFDGDITAYAYDVIKNDEYQGFILISATKDNYPILEFSKGKLPQMSSEKEEISQKLATKFATESSLSVNTDESIPVYGGATFYYNGYKVTNKKDKTEKKILIDQTTGYIIDTDKTQLSSSSTNNQDTKNAQIEEAWSSLESQMEGNLVSSRSYSHGYIPDVPFEEWYLGCSPTAAAMVLEYWDENGYPNFDTGHTLIGDLANAMGTDANGSTFDVMIDNGIEQVCDDEGYTNFNAITDTSPTLSEMKVEIDASRPFVLSMQDAGRGSLYIQPYGDHSVTCVGYTDSTTDYLFLHDTWDDAFAHYITYGNWDSAIATWVRT